MNIKRAWNLVKYAMHGKVNKGLCPICNKNTFFVEEGEYLREHYRCCFCRSQPRNRALIQVLAKQFPEYRSFRIHESSPCGPASEKIARDCIGYIPTQFYPDTPYGESKNGIRCENLECMTFPDNYFDLVITQDVVEHVMHPDRAFADIARTLKPGGAHLFTVPIFPRKKTLVRALDVDGVIQFLEEPDYHGNPVDAKGALVVREWGEDIVDFIQECSELSTTVYTVCDRNLGIDGQFTEVLVSRKPHYG